MLLKTETATGKKLICSKSSNRTTKAAIDCLFSIFEHAYLRSSVPHIVTWINLHFQSTSENVVFVKVVNVNGEK